MAYAYHELRVRLPLIALALLLGLSSVLAQAPTPPALPDCNASGPVRYICGLNGPEDLAAVPKTNWVIASPVDATKGFLSHPVWVAKALKDWTLSGSVTAQTGSPLTATIAGNRAGTASISPLRANATGAPLYSGSGYFNLAAFSIPFSAAAFRLAWPGTTMSKSNAGTPAFAK